MLSEFGKVFESLTRTSSHLHNAARALSSPSWCFQMSTSLNKDFFRYLVRMRFSIVCAFIDNDTGFHSPKCVVKPCCENHASVDISKMFTGI